MEHIEKSRFAHVGQSAQESESIKRQSLTFMQDAMRRLWKNKVAVVCVAVILLLTAMSIFAPMVSNMCATVEYASSGTLFSSLKWPR